MTARADGPPDPRSGGHIQKADGPPYGRRRKTDDSLGRVQSGVDSAGKTNIRMENSSIQYFLLETVLKEPQLLEDNFDIIVTTTHHYETFVQAFPELVSKVEVVTTVTSSETLIRTG